MAILAIHGQGFEATKITAVVCCFEQVAFFAIDLRVRAIQFEDRVVVVKIYHHPLIDRMTVTAIDGELAPLGVDHSELSLVGVGVAGHTVGV